MASEQGVARDIYLRYSGLTPKDRAIQYAKMKSAMGGKKVILVATAGSDIGLDLSFRWGFREDSSFDSVLQIRGRISRGCEYPDAELYVFRFNQDYLDDMDIHNNPAFQASRRAFRNRTETHGDLSPLYCTSMFSDEISNIHKQRLEEARVCRAMWESGAFEGLEDNFHLISSPMLHLVIDRGIAGKMRAGEFVRYSDIQTNTVNIFASQENLKMISGIIAPIEPVEPEEDYDGRRMAPKRSQGDMYEWEGEYDPENYGIYADPVFGVCQVKTLVV